MWKVALAIFLFALVIAIFLFAVYMIVTGALGLLKAIGSIFRIFFR